ncbi:hypothetical protein [Tahibacter caeni]|uniref:hypothetical protein n=1 Tax=Tahibacter caeni TaxID=1453545 RepID=UPI002148661D|nr:hypothetical protein [Tahibacter caeni]
MADSSTQKGNPDRKTNLETLAAGMFGKWHDDYQSTPEQYRSLMVAICTHLMLKALKAQGFPTEQLDLAECDAAVLAALSPQPLPVRCARLIGAGGRSAVADLLKRAGCHGRPVKEGPRRHAKGVRHA